jgi:hypothetical protein
MIACLYLFFISIGGGELKPTTVEGIKTRQPRLGERRGKMSSRRVPQLDGTQDFAELFLMLSLTTLPLPKARIT